MSVKKKTRKAPRKKRAAPKTSNRRPLIDIELPRVPDLGQIRRVFPPPWIALWDRPNHIPPASMKDCDDAAICAWIKGFAPEAGGKWDDVADVSLAEIQAHVEGGGARPPWLVYLQATINQLILAVKRLETQACNGMLNGDPYFINKDCSDPAAPGGGGGGEKGGTPPPPPYP